MDTKLRLPDLKTNLQKICRTCLIEKGNLQTIFHILDLLRECTSIQINMDDNLPKLICLDCTNKLNTAFEFRQQCEVSEKILLQLREFGETPEITVKLESNESNSLIQIENLEINEIYIKSENSYNTNENNFDVYNNNEFNDAHSTSVHSVFETSLSKTKNMSDVSKTQNIRLENENVNLSKDYSPLNIILKAKNEESHEDNDSDISWQSSDESVTLRKSKRNTKSSKLKDEAELEITQNGLSCPKCKKFFELETDLEIHMLKHKTFNDFICPKCSKPFENSIKLKRHLSTHMTNKPYKCNFCDKTFIAACDRNRHSLVHSGNKDNDIPVQNSDEAIALRKTEYNKIIIKNGLSCRQCKKFFELESDLEIHMFKHQKFDECICPKCCKSFENETKLKRHLDIHLIKKPYKCNVCERSFITVHDRKRHLLSHKEKTYSDNIPIQNSDESMNLRTNEFENITIENGFLCSQCKKFFELEEDLKIHIFKHQKFDDLVCPKCSKSFENEQGLKHHFDTHLIHKPYKCNFCDKSFVNSDDRNRHSRTHTGEKPYVCSTCGKRFTDGRRLSAHMKYHLGVRSFVCTICSKSFIFKRELRIHMRIHTGEKPYLCMECGESFSQSYSLTKHKRKHTGERPYSCTECDKSFTLNKYLKTHMLSHTGEKPYMCKICDASYTSSGSLIIHNRSHTGERPFSCNVCEKTFKSRKHLLQHKRTHNKI